jgi:hypothetical protein
MTAMAADSISHLEPEARPLRPLIPRDENGANALHDGDGRSIRRVGGEIDGWKAQTVERDDEQYPNRSRRSAPASLGAP